MKHMQIVNKFGRTVDAHIHTGLEHQDRGTADLSFYVGGCYMHMQMTAHELGQLADMLNTARAELEVTA